MLFVRAPALLLALGLLAACGRGTVLTGDAGAADASAVCPAGSYPAHDGRCVPNDSSNVCGCADDGNSCTDEVCVQGTCMHVPSHADVPCGAFSMPGRCHAGACC